MEHWLAVTVVALALINKSTRASLLATACGFLQQSLNLF